MKVSETLRLKIQRAIELENSLGWAETPVADSVRARCAAARICEILESVDNEPAPFVGESEQVIYRETIGFVIERSDGTWHANLDGGVSHPVSLPTRGTAVGYLMDEIDCFLDWCERSPLDAAPDADLGKIWEQIK